MYVILVKNYEFEMESQQPYIIIITFCISASIMECKLELWGIKQ